MAEAMHSVFVELQRQIDTYSETIREFGEKQLALLNQISETVAKAHDRVREFAKEAQRITT